MDSRTNCVKKENSQNSTVFPKKKVIQMKSRKDDKNALKFVPKLHISQRSNKIRPIEVFWSILKYSCRVCN